MPPPDAQSSLFPSEAPEPTALERATAAAQLAGFVYQFHRAVDELFDLEAGQSLGIEVLDDYHVERDGQAHSLTQVKLHQNPTALTDGSVDLWKTLGTWARAVSDGSLDLANIHRVRLLTTASLPDDSIAAAVAAADPAEAIVERLNRVPRSENETLARDFDSVRSLDSDVLVRLVKCLSIEGNAAPLHQTDELLHRRLRAAGFHIEFLAEARAALVGWVEEQLVSALADRRGPLISEEAFHLALANIRDRFTRGALPARHWQAEVTEAELAGQATSTFVRQLEFIAAEPESVRRAIRDYLRAVAERTTWIDRGEILPDLLRAYDQDLVERWEPLHAACCRECTEADETGVRAAGLRHYEAVSLLDVPIDYRWRYRYLTTGSYHFLANRRRVGWHPKYRDLLRGVAGTRTGGSLSGESEPDSE